MSKKRSSCGEAHGVAAATASGNAGERAVPVCPLSFSVRGTRLVVVPRWRAAAAATRSSTPSTDQRAPAAKVRLWLLQRY